MDLLIHKAPPMFYSKPSEDPEGGDRGSGPPLENQKLYGFL